MRDKNVLDNYTEQELTEIFIKECQAVGITLASDGKGSEWIPLSMDDTKDVDLFKD